MVKQPREQKPARAPKREKSEPKTGRGGGRAAKAEAAKGNLFATENDLEADIRRKAVALLNQQLADAHDLHSQAKQAHWNVKGPRFRSLHSLFDDLAEHVEEHIDEIAERATALGGVALGTARMAAANSRIPEYPADIFGGTAHLRALTERFGIYANSLREAIDQADQMGDADTADLLTDLSREADKDLWMLEAHLQEDN